MLVGDLVEIIGKAPYITTNSTRNTFLFLFIPENKLENHKRWFSKNIPVFMEEILDKNVTH